MHPQPRAQRWKAHELVTTGPPDQPGAPARNGFNGFLRALPGDRLVVTVVNGYGFALPGRAHKTSANLTPAPGRQDHTTSPSASASLVYRARSSLTGLSTRPAITSRSTLPRPPHPAPYVRDDRETPLCVGRDGRTCRDDLPDEPSGIFFESGLDSNLVICPSGTKSVLSAAAQSSSSSLRKAGTPRVSAIALIATPRRLF
jgi:hypothetical protein